jgi:UDP-3-O-[3-hydroxymyristoyl] N-acetylglucosamine deacetylase
MVEKILSTPDSWKLVEFTEDDLCLALQNESPAYASELAFSKV